MDLLGTGFGGDRQVDRRAVAARRIEPGRRDRELVGVERQRVARLEHLEGDAFGAREGQVFGVGPHVDPVMQRGGVARQVAGDRGGQRRRLLLGVGGAGCGQDGCACEEQRGGGGIG